MENKQIKKKLNILSDMEKKVKTKSEQYIIKFGLVPAGYVSSNEEDVYFEIENEKIREAVKEVNNFSIDQLFIYGNSIEIMCFGDEVSIIVAFENIVRAFLDSVLDFEIYNACYLKWKPTSLDTVVKYCKKWKDENSKINTKQQVEAK